MISHASNMRVSVGMCLAIRVSGCICPSVWGSVVICQCKWQLGCLSLVCMAVCPSFTPRCVCYPPALPTLSLCPSFSAALLLGTLLGSARQCLSQAKRVTALAEMAQRGLNVCAHHPEPWLGGGRSRLALRLPLW